jgi:hypothetical protein
MSREFWPSRLSQLAPRVASRPAQTGARRSPNRNARIVKRVDDGIDCIGVLSTMYVADRSMSPSERAAD